MSDQIAIDAAYCKEVFDNAYFVESNKTLLDAVPLALRVAIYRVIEGAAMLSEMTRDVIEDQTVLRCPECNSWYFGTGVTNTAGEPRCLTCAMEDSHP